jgi:hypothetical protein
MQFPKRCVFKLFRIPEDGQNPETQSVILSFTHHRQNPLDSTCCVNGSASAGGEERLSRARRVVRRIIEPIRPLWRRDECLAQPSKLWHSHSDLQRSQPAPCWLVEFELYTSLEVAVTAFEVEILNELRKPVTVSTPTFEPRYFKQNRGFWPRILLLILMDVGHLTYIIFWKYEKWSRVKWSEVRSVFYFLIAKKTTENCLVKCIMRMFKWSALFQCSSDILCASGRCCDDWGIMSIIYRIYTTGSV